MSGEMRPLAVVMSELAALLKNRASGVYYVVTDDGRFASVRMRNGRIDEIGFKAKYNDEAIQLLSQVKTARARFEQVFLTPTTSKHAPISDAMLSLMLGGFQGQAPAGAAPHVVTPAPPPVAHAPQTAGIPTAKREAIEQVALNYFGPFASVLCDEAFAATDDVDSALQKLSANAADPSEATRFLAEARAAAAKR